MPEVFVMPNMSMLAKFAVIGAAVGAIGSGTYLAVAGRKNKAKRKVQRALNAASNVISSVGYMMK